MVATHYRGEKDGDIKEYLKRRHEDGAVEISFQGYEPFKQLWEIGVVTPTITEIRLFIPDSMDQCYVVIDENTVEGLELEAHSGKKGKHNVEEILTTTEAKYWEISGLKPKAFRG